MAVMDGKSPIDAFLTGRLSSDDLLAAVDRVIADGSPVDRTVLFNDWRAKSGTSGGGSMRSCTSLRPVPDFAVRHDWQSAVLA
jgi:hypothetical protein